MRSPLHGQRAVLALIVLAPCAEFQSLPDTRPLEIEGEAWDHMVAGIDRFLLREIQRSTGKRAGCGNATRRREQLTRSLSR